MLATCNHHIVDWDPEDTPAWDAGNKKIARRNLLCTVAADHVALSIWSLWSVMALFMPASVYGFSAGDKRSLIGFCAAVGALGGVGINMALRESYLSSGTGTAAYWVFLSSYVAAAILTWIMYVRRPGSAAGLPGSKRESGPARV